MSCPIIGALSPNHLQAEVANVTKPADLITFYLSSGHVSLFDVNDLECVFTFGLDIPVSVASIDTVNVRSMG